MRPDYQAYINENIRLIILKALAAEDNATLNDWRISKELEAFGYAKTPEFIRNQLLWLEKQAGAVRTWALGTAMMAELTKAGRWHVERRHHLEGIQRPGDAE
jgi:hypothetical protein